MKKDENHIDLNFRGYINLSQTIDSNIKLTPPTPLPKDLVESQKNMVNETATSKTPTNSNSKSEN